MNSLQFQVAIDLLIATNLANRNRDIANLMSQHDYAREHCTVDVKTSRQQGKSYYIKTHATASDLVVVVNRNIYNYFDHARQVRKFHLCTISDIPDRVRGMKYDKIYVDEPGLCFKSGNIKLDEFYHTLMHPNDPTFVFLGTH